MAKTIDTTVMIEVAIALRISWADWGFRTTAAFMRSLSPGERCASLLYEEKG
jgi:hypothetical protein